MAEKDSKAADASVTSTEEKKSASDTTDTPDRSEGVRASKSGTDLRGPGFVRPPEPEPAKEEEVKISLVTGESVTVTGDPDVVASKFQGGGQVSFTQPDGSTVVVNSDNVASVG